MSRKYPRTYHLPYSPGKSNDDKVLLSLDSFINTEIVITEKIDGSNVCMESDNCYARSHSSQPKHISFDAFKAAHANIRHKLIDGTQYFGEWVFAKHSIYYSRLPNYFLLFGIRAGDRWASWDDIEDLAQELDVPTVPVLFRGSVSDYSALKEKILTLASGMSTYGDTEKEGLVIRVSAGFYDANFSTNIAKIVRANHIQTSDHWAKQSVIRNGLKHGFK